MAHIIITGPGRESENKMTNLNIGHDSAMALSDEEMEARLKCVVPAGFHRFLSGGVKMSSEQHCDICGAKRYSLVGFESDEPGKPALWICDPINTVHVK